MPEKRLFGTRLGNVRACVSSEAIPDSAPPDPHASGSERDGVDLRFEGHTRGCRRHGPESAPGGAAADYFANFAGFFSNVDLHPGEQK